MPRLLNMSCNVLRTCCRCGFENAHLKHFYMEGVGHFVPNMEPWSCRECADQIQALSPVGRILFFESRDVPFLTTYYQVVGAYAAAIMSDTVSVEPL